MDTTRQKPNRRKARKAKAAVTNIHGIRIREVRGRFVIQVRRQGLNHYEQFPSLEAARLKAEQLHQERIRHGLSAFELTTEARVAAKEALRLLSGRVGLVEAVRFWCDHHPDGSAVSTPDLVARYLADMEARKLRHLTINTARIRLTRFTSDYSDRPACTITAEDCRQWLAVRGGEARNRNNLRATIRAAFSFAVKRGIMTRNPMDGVEPVALERNRPEHWPAEQVEALLRAAQAFAPGMVPVLAVMAFAGLRPYEAQRLDWSRVNLRAGCITILGKTSKTRTDRLIEPIPANLAAWLAPYQQTRGPLAPPEGTLTRWRVRLAAVAVLGIKEVRRRLALQDGKTGTEIRDEGLAWSDIIREAKEAGPLWPVDILRHTFATFHLAAHGDIGRLAELMGNSPAIIRVHYRGLATQKEAEAYWSIAPSKEGRVIALGA